MNTNVMNDFVEIKLADDEAFLKIKETLTRIGIANQQRTKLTQTAHILQKGGRYYIVHFLQLFLLDGKEANVTDLDKARVLALSKILENWGLLKVLNEEKLKNNPEIKAGPISVYGLTIIGHSEKDKWELSSKYTFGKNRQRAKQK